MIMKRLIGLLIVMAVFACGQDFDITLGDNIHTTSSHTHEAVECLEDVSCGICGKIMQKEIECPPDNQYWGYLSLDGDLTAVTDFYWDNDIWKDKLSEISVVKTLEVCGSCSDRYGSQFHDELTNLWSALLKDFRQENSGKREYFGAKLDSQKKITDLQNQINRLQKQLNELK